MKQCISCRSYAVNIERDVLSDYCVCDVCHWRIKYEHSKAELEILKTHLRDCHSDDAYDLAVKMLNEATAENERLGKALKAMRRDRDYYINLLPGGGREIQ